MSKRLFWILMTYVERPLFWGLSLLALGGWSFIVMSGVKRDSMYSTCHPNLTLRHGAVFDMTSLDGLSAEGRASAVTDVPFDRLWNDAFDAAIREGAFGIEGVQKAAADRLASLADLPNLQRVTFTHRDVIRTGNGRPNESDLPMQTLGRLTQIGELSLSFLGVEDVRDDALQPLADLRELRQLQLEHFQPLPSLEVLADLPRLETLILVFCEGLTPQRLEEIGRLKRLRTLVLPHVSRWDRLEDSLEGLRDLPLLKTIYVACPPQDKATLSAVRTAVPEAFVLRGWYEGRRVGAFLVGMFMLLFLALGGLHLSGQFSLPQSKLVPGFTLPHAVVGAGVIATVVAIQSLLLWAHGAELWSAVAAVGAIFLSCLSMLNWMDANAGNASRASRFPRLSSVFGAFVGIVIGAAPVLLMMNAEIVAPYVELYLLGESGLLPAMLAAMTVGLAAAMAKRLATLHDTRAEAGLPVELALGDLQSGRQRTLYDSPRQAFLFRGQDRVLAEAIAKHRGDTRWSRVQRWRAGITTRLRLMIFTVVVGFATFWWILSGFAGGLTFEKALGMAGVLYLMFAMMVAMQWWQGYSQLLTALQWPLTRRTLIGDVFAAVAIDLLIPAPLIAVSVAGYLATTGAIGSSYLIAGTAMLLWSLGVASLCWAGSLWVITVRNIWAVIVFGAVTYGLGSVFLIPALMFSTQSSGPAAPTAFRIALVGGLACVIAAAFVALAYRRWMRLEFGRHF